MNREHVIEVDESVERALREDALGGKFDLLSDLNRGTHARAVIAEMNHAKALKAAGEQTWTDDDFEMRLEGVLHGNGFHSVAMQEGTYDVWDPDQSDYLDWLKKRFPENKVRVRSRKPMIHIANKFTPLPL